MVSQTASSLHRWPHGQLYTLLSTTSQPCSTTVQRGRPKFLLGKPQGLTHSAAGVVTPHGGSPPASMGCPGGPWTGWPGRWTAQKPGTPRCPRCLRTCIGGRYAGVDRGPQGAGGRPGWPWGPGGGAACGCVPAPDSTQQRGAWGIHTGRGRNGRQPPSVVVRWRDSGRSHRRSQLHPPHGKAAARQGWRFDRFRT